MVGKFVKTRLKRTAFSKNTNVNKKYKSSNIPPIQLTTNTLSALKTK